MPRPEEYKAARQVRKEKRLQCTERLKKLVPLIKALCGKYGIAVNAVPSGYQFRTGEYIVTWWLPTNRIIVQYAGSDENHPFEADLVQGEPKILTALKKLVRITKGDGPSPMI
jgi:hypothetical protein